MPATVPAPFPWTDVWGQDAAVETLRTAVRTRPPCRTPGSSPVRPGRAARRWPRRSPRR
jgi:hypothetical protein